MCRAAKKEAREKKEQKIMKRKMKVAKMKFVKSKPQKEENGTGEEGERMEVRGEETGAGYPGGACEGREEGEKGGGREITSVFSDISSFEKEC